MCLHLHNKT